MVSTTDCNELDRLGEKASIPSRRQLEFLLIGAVLRVRIFSLLTTKFHVDWVFGFGEGIGINSKKTTHP